MQIVLQEFRKLTMNDNIFYSQIFMRSKKRPLKNMLIPGDGRKFADSHQCTLNFKARNNCVYPERIEK